MTTKHTAGESVYDPKNFGRDFNLGIGVYADNGRILRTVIHVPHPDDVTAQNNARVIAAAPSLLAELQEIVAGWEVIEQGKIRYRSLTAWEAERLNMARDVIRKATGGAA